MNKEQNLQKPQKQALNIPVVGRSVSKSKYWKDCPKCGLKMTYGQLVTEEGYCWSCNHRGVFNIIEMERTYRLEFNEKQQNFHLDNYTHEEGTHGWFTIFEHCTDVEFKVYEAFVNRIPNKKLTKEYLLKCASEVKGFTNNLLEYGLVVGRP